MVRPQHLVLPLDKERPSIVYFDRFLNVPPRYNLSQAARIDLQSYFESKLPIALEYCSGHGHWIVEQAKCNPQYNWVAIEMEMSRAKCIWAKIKNNQLSNCLVVCSEGYSFSHHLLEEESIDQIFINFPDPWPKRRHHKNRIIQQRFLVELERIITPRGLITFVTDDQEYATYFLRTVRDFGRFEQLPQQPLPPDYGYSFFGEIFGKEGKQIAYYQIRPQMKSQVNFSPVGTGECSHA